MRLRPQLSAEASIICFRERSGKEKVQIEEVGWEVPRPSLWLAREGRTGRKTRREGVPLHDALTDRAAAITGCQGVFVLAALHPRGAKCAEDRGVIQDVRVTFAFSALLR